MPRKDIAARNCVQCGIPYRHGNPAYKTCGSPRCVNAQRRSKWTDQNRAARERRRAESIRKREEEVKKAQRMRRLSGEPRSDEAARRKIITAVQKELDRGSPQADAMFAVASQINEPTAVVLSVWRSRDDR